MILENGIDDFRYCMGPEHAVFWSVPDITVHKFEIKQGPRNNWGSRQDFVLLKNPVQVFVLIGNPLIVA